MLTFLVANPKDNKDFFHKHTHLFSWHRHGFQKRTTIITTIKNKHDGNLLNYHEHKNDQNNMNFQRHKPTMTKIGLILNPNMKHVNQRTKTWSVQDIGLNVILLWKHENYKIEIWCKIIPKINVE
jgi:hypothetical protein